MALGSIVGIGPRVGITSAPVPPKVTAAPFRSPKFTKADWHDPGLSSVSSTLFKSILTMAIDEILSRVLGSTTHRYRSPPCAALKSIFSKYYSALGSIPERKSSFGSGKPPGPCDIRISKPFFGVPLSNIVPPIEVLTLGPQGDSIT